MGLLWALRNGARDMPAGTCPRARDARVGGAGGERPKASGRAPMQQAVAAGGLRLRLGANKPPSRRGGAGRRGKAAAGGGGGQGGPRRYGGARPGAGGRWHGVRWGARDAAVLAGVASLALPLLVSAPCTVQTLTSLQDLDGTIYEANPESFGVGLDAVVIGSETSVEVWGEGSTPLEDDTQLAYPCNAGYTGAVEPGSDLASTCAQGFAGFAIFQCHGGTESFQQTAFCQPVTCDGTTSTFVAQSNIEDAPYSVTVVESPTEQGSSFEGSAASQQLSGAMGYSSELVYHCQPGHWGSVTYTCKESGNFEVSDGSCTGALPSLMGAGCATDSPPCVRSLRGGAVPRRLARGRLHGPVQ